MNDSKPQKNESTDHSELRFLPALARLGLPNPGKQAVGCPVLTGVSYVDVRFARFHTDQQITQWLGALPEIPAWGSMLRRLKGIAETQSNTQEPACYRGSRTARSRWLT
jgi:hypothetical protein